MWYAIVKALQSSKVFFSSSVREKMKWSDEVTIPF